MLIFINRNIPHIWPPTVPQVFQCSTCHHLFCLDCDLFIHESLHSCPGCASTRSELSRISKEPHFKRWRCLVPHTAPQMFQCSTCRHLFSPNFDLFIHESLQSSHKPPRNLTSRGEDFLYLKLYLRYSSALPVNTHSVWTDPSSEYFVQEKRGTRK